MIGEKYKQTGYELIKGVLPPEELSPLKAIIQKFHSQWVQHNQAHYNTKAINSADLTASKYLNANERLRLLQFVSCTKMMGIVNRIFAHPPAFMNTQLFFNPVTKEQKNYWHKDAQYHLNIEEQKAALNGPEVIHFRLALEDEPGIEVIPQSHRCWDSPEELDTRLQRNGRLASDALAAGKKIPLQAGDLLIFSANITHRGLYGMNRFAFDILYCEPVPELLKFIDIDCLPDKSMMQYISNPDIFQYSNT